MADNNFFSQNPIAGKRHQLLVAKDHQDSSAPRGPYTPKPLIPNLKKLQEDLQYAIELEHSTIPPYLTALYSIKDGANQEAANIIRSVVMEEMLHMMLACNILNAIGGSPAINKDRFVPDYPTFLPNSDDTFQVNLAPFSKLTIDTFLAIEKPAPPLAPPQADEYHSIGQFYDAIKEALIRLDAEQGIFIKDHSRQITAEDYYGSGGMLIPVHNLEDAITAINEIVGQGEGVDHSITDSDHVLFGEDVEYAHYFRFNEIRQERHYQRFDTPKSGPTGKPLPVDWTAVHNIKHNIKMNDFVKGSQEWEMMYDFNKTYRLLLDTLHDAVNGKKEEFKKAVAVMYQLKYKAVALMNVPIGNGLFAAPSFEFVR